MVVLIQSIIIPFFFYFSYLFVFRISPVSLSFYRIVVYTLAIR